jgi:hypothetical protein
MLLRRFTDYILRGRLQAMSTAFVLGFIPVLGLISSLIATLVTLRKGAQEGALVFVAATLPILLVYAGMPPDHGASDGISTIDIVVMISTINVIAWVSAVILRRFSSWSWVLDLIGILTVIVIIVLHLQFPEIQTWWQNWLTNYFAAVGLSQGDGPHLKDVTGIVASIKNYATGLAAVMLSFYALLSLVIGRWWQDAMFNPGGLRQELMAIRLSYLVGTIFLLGLFLSFWGIPVVLDAMPILYMIFALAGLSLMHYLVKAINVKWWWLITLYIVLSIVPQSIIVIAMAGLLDTAFNFRKRWPIKNSLIS